MTEQLLLLKKIDTLDMEIVALKIEKGNLPDQILTLKKRVLDKKYIFTGQQKKADEIKEKIDELKKKVNEESEKLQKSNDRLNTVKNNKEFEAVQQEIKSHKESIDTWETEELELMDQLEQLETAMPESEKVYLDLRTKYLPEIEKLQNRLDTADSRIAEIGQEIPKLKEGLKKNIITYYEKLLKSKYTLLLNKKQGNIVGELKSGLNTCSVCSTELIKQKIQDVRKGEAIVCCDACGSILFWQE